MNTYSSAAALNVDHLATIWSLIESRTKFPAMIVVASATDADDTTTIARGLASVAHQAGQRTSYLDLSGSSEAQLHPYSKLAIAPRAPQREAFDEARPIWLARFDVLIVDAATLRTQPIGAHIARVADGIVIGLCKERRVVSADRELASLLSQLSANILGAVLTEPAQKRGRATSTISHATLSHASAP